MDARVLTVAQLSQSIMHPSRECCVIVMERFNARKLRAEYSQTILVIWLLTNNLKIEPGWNTLLARLLFEFNTKQVHVPQISKIDLSPNTKHRN